MIQTAWEKLKAWLANRWPAVRDLALAWWNDLEENPKLHFISMVVGMLLYLGLKLAVYIAR